MRTALLFTFISFLPFLSSAQELFTADTSYVRFFSQSPLEDIEAINKECRSLINTADNQFAFMIPIIKFKFDSPLMEEHFNENYMETTKFPNASFKGKVNEKVDLSIEGAYPVSVTGKLKIHGVEMERTIKGTIINKKNRLTVDAKFMIKVADHKVKIPKLVIMNIAEDVECTVHFSYIPK